ncbi:hypothetical protein [Bosea sp. RAC05]|uniref:hypothetical protein n=1 Tax=Bosea sp. RAC05 TaxID=1842539 RepID=UPI0008589FD0|nr:hypothetical protein [Bosea sp. RAC05]AOG02982.1 hypothetical protein BSY19_5208 [Bosea sp. RAC05]
MRSPNAPEPPAMAGGAIVLVLLMVAFVTWMRIESPPVGQNGAGGQPSLSDWKAIQRLSRQ